MPAQTPDELGELFRQALNAGDLDALVALYEPNASLKPMPDDSVSGHEAIREALAGLLAMKPRMSLEARTIGEADDLALTTSRWEMMGIGPDGQPVAMAGQGVEIARRQLDGTWRWVFDTPWGLGWDRLE